VAELPLEAGKITIRSWSMPMTTSTLLVLTATAGLLLSGFAAAQTKQYPLETVDGLVLHHVTAEPVTLQGKKGLRVTRAGGMPGGQEERVEHIVQIANLEFSNGVIELELAGAPAADAGAGARGFVGVAFRLQDDKKTFDAFYLRPTNGRADDQERRNHSTQYISHPAWPWPRLRKETPGRYESYVDLVAGEWTKIKIEVRGDRARLYVHDSEQPALIVNDVKSGADAKGAVALWIEAGTVAHFRNLTVNLTPPGK
jgi:hypothetical protein